MASVGLGSMLFLAACSTRPPDETVSCVARDAAARAQKDRAFSTEPDPVPQNRKKDLLPLAYFRLDPEYCVPAVLKPSNDPTIVQMATSTGTERQMRRVGTLEFLLKGQSMKLTAFLEVGAKDLNQLFVPFTDLTSGTETYPGGRYLDLERTPTGIYEVDFNRAYNPYCYYNPTWECPYPPPENRLKLPIRAGERMKALDVGAPGAPTRGPGDATPTRQTASGTPGGAPGSKRR